MTRSQLGCVCLINDATTAMPFGSHVAVGIHVSPRGEFGVASAELLARNKNMTRMETMARGLQAFALSSAVLLATAAAAWAQDAKVITMRLSTATLNDSQHEWMK